MQDGRTGTELVPVSPYGPFHRFVDRIRELNIEGRVHDALAEIDLFEWIAEAFGDRRTADFMLQRRMYTYLHLQQHEPALSIGAQLVARHRASGNLLGEARTLADLAELCMLTGRDAEGMRYLARAGLLLESTTRRNDCYVRALASCGDAAIAAGLHEIAAAFYDAYYAGNGPDQDGYIPFVYSALLVSWGLWLDHLGRNLEAGHRWRRLAAITDTWLTSFGRVGRASHVQILTGTRALALAKLGRTDEALALAQRSIAGPGTGSYTHPELWTAHLALAVASRARGEFTAAGRELVAAEHLVSRGIRADDRLLVQYELATLTAEVLGQHVETVGADIYADVLGALQGQAQQLWRQRRQRMTMLRQARQREQLEIEHARAHAALLRDPLTGLGNRRHFDQLMADIYAGNHPSPTTLLLVDVDNFKSINDTHSHSAGDEILRELARIIGAHCRQGIDTPIRYAGDEFTIFLNSDPVNAVSVAERIRAAVSATDFSGTAPGTPVSISTGVAALRCGMTPTELFHTADTNLYRAKRAGRNRVAA